MDTGHTTLTNREMEILKIIAEGLNNRAIATQLVITEQTVKGHVSNILSKLHLADRTQAAVYAWREGVVGPDPD
ncbi:MAG TPA: response regulator transcription factor [Chloroflexota bacterium]|nr:response regulator transcription factor [Chloroflexota bacterium]